MGLAGSRERSVEGGWDPEASVSSSKLNGGNDAVLAIAGFGQASLTAAKEETPLADLP
ncbi:MAG: hypothetical protein U0V48_14995 [Anaerolineales bacterium]